MSFFPCFKNLNATIVDCRRCPRLVAYRESVEPRASFAKEPYWRKPVPGFGDANGWLLLLGLAPAAHGGNRTGRIFTGDPSGAFLMQALHATGFANQPSSQTADDGLILHECYITAAVKCVPPKNVPTSKEFANCFSYFMNEFFLLKNLQAILALGREAFHSYLRFLALQDISPPKETFSHGAKVTIPHWPTLYGSYHPSPQNTYTGKLTQEMLQAVLREIKKEKKA